jgi:hypothetical protein
MTNAEILLSFAGGVMAIAQALGLFILSDLRARIMRLEAQQMVVKPAGGGD